MKCFNCGSELCWQSDFDSEEIGYEPGGIVSFYSCLNEDCQCEYEVYMPDIIR